MLANAETAAIAAAQIPANDSFPEPEKPSQHGFSGVQMLPDDRKARRGSALSRILASHLFDMTDSALLLTDSEERVVLANQHWTDLSGLEADAIAGRTLGEGPVAGASEAIADLLHLARLSGDPVSGSVENKHVRGYSLGLEARVIPLRDDDGESASGFLCIVKAAGLTPESLPRLRA
ncbi:MAG: PAS domain-containing protein [Proteobacteria bacterium]|nr:PAS domain-containing protein [Pseudomonadota bacterium]